MPRPDMTTTPPTNLRLMDTFRNLFYTPIYVAVSGGFFYKRGLNVMLTTMPEGGSAMDILRSGEVDIAQTGISRSLMELDLGHEDAPLHIAEINSRDGFFLVSRQSVDAWDWKMLEGATVAPVGFTPVPWNSLRAAMLKHDVDLDAVNLATGLSAQEAIDSFRSGRVDYVHLPHPQAGSLVAEGAGHIAVALGPELGHICYSSFAAMPEYIEANPDMIQSFVNGFDDALAWLACRRRRTGRRARRPLLPRNTPRPAQRLHKPVPRQPYLAPIVTHYPGVLRCHARHHNRWRPRQVPARLRPTGQARVRPEIPTETK